MEIGVRLFHDELNPPSVTSTEIEALDKLGSSGMPTSEIGGATLSMTTNGS